MKIFLICSVPDETWARGLLSDLQATNHTVSLVTPNKAPRALISSPQSAMLVIVSPESALGETADWLERIWRAYLAQGGTVIPCLVPDAPPGAKNWMQFDLYTQVPVDFGEDNALKHVLARLAPPAAPQQAPPPPVIKASVTPTLQQSPPQTVEPTSSVSVTQDASPQPAMLPPVLLPPPPPAETQSTMPDVLQEPPQMSMVNYILSIVAGFILVIMIWLAALQQTVPGGPPLLLWIGGVALVVGSLFTLGQIELARRRRQRFIEQRYAQARRYAKSDIKPQIYVEVIQSFLPQENDLVWEMRGDTFSIGTRYNASLPLIAHVTLDEIVALIFYENGNYFIENTSRETTIQLIDQQLNPSSTAVLNNGELITLPSIVLQFRIDMV